ncbi:MAG: alpha/beta hydrolase [Verrucomicrobiota bacterium]
MEKTIIGYMALGLLSCFNLAALAAESAAGSQGVSGSVNSQPDEVLRLWPGDAPNLLPDREAEVADEKGFIQHTSVPELFVYLPKKEQARGTAVIICPGGAYAGVAMRAHVENALQMFHEQGIAVFGLKYRTSYGKNDPEADALADGQRALRIVRSRASEWGIDPHRIGVQGYSAGSHLCLNLASRFDEGQPGTPDPLDRFSSRPDFVVLMCPWPYKKQTAEYFPLSCNTPPAFIANARDDKDCFSLATSVDNRLKALGVEEMLFIVETGGHAAFHLGLSKGLGGEWPKHLMPWLKKIGMLK